jgi:hypothetical protein
MDIIWILYGYYMDIICILYGYYKDIIWIIWYTRRWPIYWAKWQSDDKPRDVEAPDFETIPHSSLVWSRAIYKEIPLNIFGPVGIQAIGEGIELMEVPSLEISLGLQIVGQKRNPPPSVCPNLSPKQQNLPLKSLNPGVLVQALLLQLEPPNLQRLGGLEKWWLWYLSSVGLWEERSSGSDKWTYTADQHHYQIITTIRFNE